ncbi:MAG: HDOD domain-containing protein [Burkholderiales bacterium]|nr:HDOD domain-containing protein [Burkholderiales bacterium]
MALWNPLRKLFGEAPVPRPAAAPPRPAERAAPRAAPSEPTVATAQQGDQAAAAPPPDPLPALAARFGASLLGGGEPMPHPPSAAERDALARLHALAERGLDADAVPRLPAVLPKLMALARRDDVSPREISELLARDPALVGEVVRLANSPRYRTQRPIEDLTGALMLLGQLGLSQLVMRAAVRPIFKTAQGRLGQAAAARLWELSERCGHACGSRRAGFPDAFSAYLAGTAAPVGLIVALRVLDQGMPVVAPGSQILHAGMWRQALRLSAQAAGQWDFPDEVAQSLTHLAGASMGAAEAAGDPLTQALRQALAAALSQALGCRAEGAAALPPTEAALAAELDRIFAREVTA